MIAIDTNVLSEIMAGKEFDIDDEIFIPYVVLAEVKYGLAASNHPDKKKQLEAFMASDSVTVSSGLSHDVLDMYVAIASHLKKNGTPVSPNDMWIAAECLVLDLVFLTRDSDFDRIPDLMLA